jgi:amino acid adenylation domain-containing protein
VDFHIYNQLHEAGEIKILCTQAIERTNFTLEISVTPDAVEVYTRDMEVDWANRIAGYFLRALRQLAANPAEPFTTEQLLTAEELRDLGQVQAKFDTEFPDVVGEFLNQARLHPGAPALLSAGESLTYAELETLSRNLGARLHACGVRAGDIVALACDRSPEAIAGIIGILMAGAAYLPLDLHDPRGRVDEILREARPAAVVIGATMCDSLAITVAIPIVTIRTTESPTTLGFEPARFDPDALACVLYTSGSTGRPNGVMVTRGGLACVTDFHVREFGLGYGARVLQFASLTFDSSIPEIFAVLCAGAAVCLVSDKARSGPALARFVDEMEITHATLPPAVLASMPASNLPCLRMIGSAGEPCPQNAVRRWAPGRRFLNLYGPTETTVDALVAECVDDGDEPPLGRPVPSAVVYLCGPDLEIVPRGATGEILIGSPQVARGYLGRPDLTAERFLPDPWSTRPGARLYRTGDLARYDADGKLHWVGRVDDQLKVRGIRIEPGEVESILRRHPAVRACSVVMPHAPHRSELIAHVCLHDGATATCIELRSFARQNLPHYMAPTAFLFWNELPLTPNGKIDRTALEDVEAPAESVDFDIFAGPEQETVAALWRDVLGVSVVGANQDFFALGGDSLKAMQVAARVRAVLNVELPVRVLFEEPTVARLSAWIAHSRGNPVLPPIVPVERGRPLPLSDAQRRLWILHQLEPDGSTYNVPSAVRLSGPLDSSALERALEALVRRHEVLRSTFAAQDGYPVQIVRDEPSLTLRRVEIAAGDLAGRLQRDVAAPFDLAHGPLLRASLYRLGPAEHVLCLTAHHIVCDGWSTHIIVRELCALYESFVHGSPATLVPLPVQYADYAAWQAGNRDAKGAADDLRFITGTLEGAARVLDLPLDRPRRTVPCPRGGRVSFAVPAPTRRAVEDFAHAEGATPFMVLLASFGMLLARYTGQNDLLIGSPVANRPRIELEPLIGFFANTLPLRVRVAGTVRDVVARVRQLVVGAFAHQSVPFESVVEALVPERDLTTPPLIQATFALHGELPAIPSLAGLSLEWIDIEFATAKFELSLNVHEEAGEWSAVLEYNNDLFDPRTVRSMTEHFSALLESLVGMPDCQAEEIPILTPADRRCILDDWNNTAVPYPRSAAISTLFEEVARRKPGRVALSMANRFMTYAELDASANQMAAQLARVGAGAGVAIGILLPRSFDLIVAILGALKTGACYVPFEPGPLPERLREAAADAGVTIWVVDEMTAAHVPASQTTVRIFAGDCSEESEQPFLLPARATDPAYIMSTSGSTGRPKWVAIPHQAVVRLVVGQSYCPLGPEEVFLQMAPAWFDAATFEIWGALLHGARLAIAPAGPVGMVDLENILRDEGITTLWLTAGLFHQVVDERIGVLSRLKTLLAGGDVLSPPRVNRLLRELPGVRLVNGYGPTENTTFAACHAVDREIADGGTVPIGRPISNTRVYVLDPYLQPVPAGTWAELYTAGDGLAIGYVGDPVSTAESFLPDPFSSQPGGRLYRTGDIARWTRDGLLEFGGRRDNQVKLRGYRVEPTEVEAALRKNPNVRDSAVIVRAAGEDKQLIAYVVPRTSTLDNAGLRAFLRSMLPEYMVPSAFVTIDRIPLGKAGKLDYAALPDPFGASQRIFQPPSGEIEITLARIWSDVLQIEQIGAADNFFALGGHSLRAFQLVSRIREILHIELPLRDVFELQTVAALAQRIRELRTAALPTRATEQRMPAPLSFGQEQLFSFERLSPGSVTYNVPFALRVRGPLDSPALLRALREVTRRHEVLRSNIRIRDGVPVQLAEREEIEVEEIDLSDLPSSCTEQMALSQAEATASQPFDLQHDPLVRLKLWRLDPAHHVLLCSMHHIVCDGWSLDILLRETSVLYEAFAGGRPSPLPELEMQYADFAREQRAACDAAEMSKQLSYWRQAMADAPLHTELPGGSRRPVRSYEGAQQSCDLAAHIQPAVQRLATNGNCTPYMVLVAAFQAWLARYAGQDDIVVGSPIARRPNTDTETLIGFFVNTILLRASLRDNPSFEDFLGRVWETTLEAFAHADAPLHDLLQDLNVMFVYQESRRPAFEARDLICETVPLGNSTAKFDLSLIVSNSGAHLNAAFEYRTAVLEPHVISRMLGDFTRFLTAAVERPHERIYDLPLTQGSEKLRATRIRTES